MGTKLVKFIHSHGFKAYRLPNGTICARMEFFNAPSQWEVIEPTVSHVRDWLGY